MPVSVTVKARNLLDRLRSWNRPRAWACAYFAILLVFGGVFSRLHGQFTQSTLKAEPRTLLATRQLFAQDLIGILSPYLRRRADGTRPSMSLDMDNVRPDGADLLVTLNEDLISQHNAVLHLDYCNQGSCIFAIYPSTDALVGLDHYPGHDWATHGGTNTCGNKASGYRALFQRDHNHYCRLRRYRTSNRDCAIHGRTRGDTGHQYSRPIPSLYCVSVPNRKRKTRTRRCVTKAPLRDCPMTRLVACCLAR